MENNQGRPRRDQQHTPDEHKTQRMNVGGLDLSLTERIYILRVRAGYTNSADLARACREILPKWVTMNRRLIQEIEGGKIKPSEVNDIWLIAIAQACGEKASDVFGIKDLRDSGDLGPIADLLTSQGLIRPLKADERVELSEADDESQSADLGEQHSGWYAETAGQRTDFGHASARKYGFPAGWFLASKGPRFALC